MPALPKNVTGSSLVSRPWCETVSIFTVWPDLMVSAGGRSAVRYPQITVSGVERSVASGVAFGGTVCAPAEEARPAIIHATTQRIRISINEVRIDDLPGKNHGDDHGINGRAFTVELKTVASTCLHRNNGGAEKIAPRRFDCAAGQGHERQGVGPEPAEPGLAHDHVAGRPKRAAALAFRPRAGAHRTDQARRRTSRRDAANRVARRRGRADKNTGSRRSTRTSHSAVWSTLPKCVSASSA